MLSVYIFFESDPMDPLLGSNSPNENAPPPLVGPQVPPEPGDVISRSRQFGTDPTENLKILDDREIMMNQSKEYHKIDPNSWLKYVPFTKTHDYVTGMEQINNQRGGFHASAAFNDYAKTGQNPGVGNVPEDSSFDIVSALKYGIPTVIAGGLIDKAFFGGGGRILSAIKNKLTPNQQGFTNQQVLNSYYNQREPDYTAQRWR